MAGEHYGRVRAMVNDAGENVDHALPSYPVEILGLSGTPDAGDEFSVVENERGAKELVEFRRSRSQEARIKQQQAARLDSLFDNMGEGEKPTINLVLKTDVRGSLEALVAAVGELSNDEVKVKVVSSGVGGINESDANLAVASGAVVLGFNVRADASSKKIIEQEGLDLRYYSVIYELLDDLKDALSGMLAPNCAKKLWVSPVRDVFRSPSLVPWRAAWSRKVRSTAARRFACCVTMSSSTRGSSSRSVASRMTSRRSGTALSVVSGSQLQRRSRRGQDRSL